MCDFKPGDKLVCVNGRSILCAGGCLHTGSNAPVGEVRVVQRITFDDCGCAVVVWGEGRGEKALACRFRRVERRDLVAWLETAATDTDHLDKPIKTPARPKVDALLQRVQSGEFG